MVKDVDQGYDALRRRVKNLGKHSIEVGLPGEIAEQQSSDGRSTLLDIGLWMEFGTSDGHVPARPWLRGFVDENESKALALLNLLIGQVVRGDMTELDAINDFGRWCVDGIRERILRHIAPENAPATLANKDGDIPLIDQEVFFSSIAYKVIDELSAR